MPQRTQSRAHYICAATVWLTAASAAAQVNPELGDTSTSQVTTQTTTVSTPAPAAASTSTTTTDTSAATTTDTTPPNRFPDTDHGMMVGRFGVGFFGVMNVPVAGPNENGDITLEGQVLAPTIGVRYWLQDALGIEVGLGIGITSSGTHMDNGNTSVDSNGPSIFALGLHGGLPLVFAASRHFAFEVIPEINIAFATGGIDDETAANQDVDLSGFLLELGGRVGAEIQFGFIDIPQLALQASVGVHLRYEGRGISQGNTDTSGSNFRFGTTVQDEPWDLFTGNLSAIYYF